jgi:hypothetical protein
MERASSTQKKRRWGKLSMDSEREHERKRPMTGERKLSMAGNEVLSR